MSEETTLSYTAGQLAILAELQQIQDESKLSNEKLCATWLTISATTLSRLRSGKYGADAADVFVKLDTNLRRYREERAMARKRGEVATYYPLTEQQSVLSAVTGARLKDATNPDRLIVVLGETGAGKTATAAQVAAQFDGLTVEARETWRTDYYSAIKSIGQVAGVDAEKLDAGKASAETALIERLRKNRRVLGIDEGEYFGPRTMNLVKLILNQTETVVVIYAIPELFQRWSCKAWKESEQLKRRLHTLIDLGRVQPADVRLFIENHPGWARLDGDERKKITAQLAMAANTDFRLKTMRALQEQLADSPALTEESVASAIARTRRLVGLTA